ncbi:hypothetical protein DFH07DRAFT_968298 [Mycena maculata]|uniref:Uncharacterized protein n=1 Tax=Mycena maculata TaxID=230809 RepID=A0AAD7MU49_9AGAR|nr:hypothetical protein DFH07DRAFT_968298 [Mycena maculata]
MSFVSVFSGSLRYSDLSSSIGYLPSPVPRPLLFGSTPARYITETSAFLVDLFAPLPAKFYEALLHDRDEERHGSLVRGEYYRLDIAGHIPESLIESYRYYRRIEVCFSLYFFVNVLPSLIQCFSFLRSALILCHIPLSPLRRLSHPLILHCVPLLLPGSEPPPEFHLKDSAPRAADPRTSFSPSRGPPVFGPTLRASPAIKPEPIDTSAFSFPTPGIHVGSEVIEITGTGDVVGAETGSLSAHLERSLSVSASVPPLAALSDGGNTAVGDDDMTGGRDEALLEYMG